MPTLLGQECFRKQSRGLILGALAVEHRLDPSRCLFRRRQLTNLLLARSGDRPVVADCWFVDASPGSLCSRPVLTEKPLRLTLVVACHRSVVRFNRSPSDGKVGPTRT